MTSVGDLVAHVSTRAAHVRQHPQLTIHSDTHATSVQLESDRECRESPCRHHISSTVSYFFTRIDALHDLPVTGPQPRAAAHQRRRCAGLIHERASYVCYFANGICTKASSFPGAGLNHRPVIRASVVRVSSVAVTTEDCYTVFITESLGHELPSTPSLGFPVKLRDPY